MIDKSFQIDLWKAYKTPIEIVQYEGDGRVLNFVLTSNGQAVDLTASTVVLYATKPSGEDIYDSCTVTDATAGKVSFTVTTQVCLEIGTLNCFIEITTADPTVTRTQLFEITVKESKDVSEAAESTSEFTALTEALATVTEYDARITQNESDISDNADDIATNAANISDNTDDIATNAAAIDTKVTGAGTVTDGHIVQFDGTGGKNIKGGISITTTVDDPGTDNEVPTAKAVRDLCNLICSAIISTNLLLSYRNIGGAL